MPLTLHTLPNPTNPDAKTNSNTVIPRLISVAEIIKREYIKLLQEQRSARLYGLHQYNQLGVLEDLSPAPADDEETDRVKMITSMLNGSKNT